MMPKTYGGRALIRRNSIAPTVPAASPGAGSFPAVPDHGRSAKLPSHARLAGAVRTLVDVAVDARVLDDTTLDLASREIEAIAARLGRHAGTPPRGRTACPVPG